MQVFATEVLATLDLITKGDSLGPGEAFVTDHAVEAAGFDVAGDRMAVGDQVVILAFGAVGVRRRGHRYYADALVASSEVESHRRMLVDLAEAGRVKRPAGAGEVH